jgi:acyl-CoA thioester hydrolase
LLRSIGYEQDQLQQELGIIFAVHSANIQYKKPARFNNELNVLTSITSLGKASIDFKQSIYLGSSQEMAVSTGSVSPELPAELLSEAEIKIACLNATKFTPQSIPASIIEKINKEFHCGS